MPINQIATSNTFAEWVSATSSLITQVNNLTDTNFSSNASITFTRPGTAISVNNVAVINVITSNTLTTSTLNVTGNSVFANANVTRTLIVKDLIITGSYSLGTVSYNNIDASGYVNAASYLRTSSYLTVGTFITQSGANSTFAGQVAFTNATTSLTTIGDVYLGKNAFVTANLSTSGNLIVSRDSTLSGNLTVSKDATITGNLSTTGNLIVSKDATITGNLSTSGNLSISKNATITGNLSTSGNLIVSKDATITGKLSINNLLASGITGNSNDILISAGPSSPNYWRSNSSIIVGFANNATYLNQIPASSYALTSAAGSDTVYDSLRLGGTLAASYALTSAAGSDTVYNALRLGGTLAASYALLASPTFTGTPSLPTGTTGVTQASTDNSTKIATTAYVKNATLGGISQSWQSVTRALGTTYTNSTGTSIVVFVTTLGSDAPSNGGFVEYYINGTLSGRQNQWYYSGASVWRGLYSVCCFVVDIGSTYRVDENASNTGTISINLWKELRV